jgi:hypothetical protein
VKHPLRGLFQNPGGAHEIKNGGHAATETLIN